MQRQVRKKYDWGLIRHKYVTSPDGPAEVTLDSLRRKYGCSARQIKRLSSKERWPKLRAEWREKAAVKAQADAAETAAQRLIRHAKTLRLIQAKGIKALQEEGVIPSARDTIEATKAERLIFGEPDSRAEVIGGMEAKLTSEQRIAIYRIMEECHDDE